MNWAKEIERHTQRKLGADGKRGKKNRAQNSMPVLQSHFHWNYRKLEGMGWSKLSEASSADYWNLAQATGGRHGSQEQSIQEGQLVWSWYVGCRKLDEFGPEAMHYKTGWWLQICFIFIPIGGKWSNLTSIFFRWVGSTTNQKIVVQHVKRSFILLFNRKSICRPGRSSAGSGRSAWALWSWKGLVDFIGFLRSNSDGEHPIWMFPTEEAHPKITKEASQDETTFQVNSESPGLLLPSQLLWTKRKHTWLVTWFLGWFSEISFKRILAFCFLNSFPPKLSRSF